jgi:hypothetical protein
VNHVHTCDEIKAKIETAYKTREASLARIRGMNSGLGT